MNWSVEWHRPGRGGAEGVEAIAQGLAEMVLHGVSEQGDAALPARSCSAAARKS